jgi:hypothetical protein
MTLKQINAQQMPVPLRSKTRLVLDSSKSETMGSNPTRGVHACMYAFFFCVVMSDGGSGLTLG